MAYYWRGQALHKADNLTEARAAWEQVLTLGDEKFTKLAQKVLEENPLQDTADKCSP